VEDGEVSEDDLPLTCLFLDLGGPDGSKGTVLPDQLDCMVENMLKLNSNIYRGLY